MNQKYLIPIIFVLLIVTVSSSSALLTSGLFAYYTLDGNTTSVGLMNNISKVYNITLTGTPNNLATGCKIGKCYNLTGTGIQAAPSNRLNINFTGLNANMNNSFSIGTWMRFSTNIGAAGYQYFAFGRTGSNAFLLTSIIDTTQFIIYQTNGTGGNSGNFVPTRDGNLHYYVFINNGKNNLLIYEDAVLKVNTSVALSTPLTPDHFNFLGGGLLEQSEYSTAATVTYDEIGFWNRTLSGAEILSLNQTYNTGVSYPFGEVLSPFTFNTPSESLTTKYLPNNYLMINVSVNISNFINSTINVYNSTALFYSYLTTNTTQYLNLTLPFVNDTYYYNVTATNTTSTVDSSTYTNYIVYAKLNVTALNITGGNITYFNLTVTNLNRSTTEYYTVTNGYANVNTVLYNVYNILWNATGYAYSNKNVNITSTLQTVNTTLYPDVSIIINIFDEATLAYILQNITVTVTDMDRAQTYSTTTVNGNLTVLNLTGGDTYEIRFTTANYSTTRYYRQVINRQYDVLNAYLLQNSVAQNFSICFYDVNGGIVTDLHLYQYLLSGSNYYLVQDGYTDLNGRLVLAFNPSKYYYYTWNSTLYAISSFILNPPQNNLVLADGCNYDITLQYASAVIEYNNINVTGSYSYNNITKILTVSYTSLDPTITNYSYTVNKVVSGVYTTICSGSDTTYPTDSFLCDLTGYYGDIYIQEVANNAIVFYGNTVNIPGLPTLFDNLQPKDAAYYTGFIMLIIVFAGLFLGLFGTLIAGVLGLFIIAWIGILTPVTTILIVVDIIIVGVIAFSLRR